MTAAKPVAHTPVTLEMVIAWHEKQAEYFAPFGAMNVLSTFHAGAAATIVTAAAHEREIDIDSAIAPHAWPCGCAIAPDGAQWLLTRCPLHDAAPALLAALEASEEIRVQLVGYMQSVASGEIDKADALAWLENRGHESDAIGSHSRAAINQARGQA